MENIIVLVLGFIIKIVDVLIDNSKADAEAKKKWREFMIAMNQGPTPAEKHEDSYKGAEDDLEKKLRDIDAAAKK